MNLKKLATLAALTALICPLSACEGNVVPQPTPTVDSSEVEDCDAEDWINREADCGFVVKPSTKPKPPAVKTPVTIRTRR